MLYKVILNFKFVDETLVCDQMIAIAQYFKVVFDSSLLPSCNFYYISQHYFTALHSPARVSTFTCISSGDQVLISPHCGMARRKFGKLKLLMIYGSSWTYFVKPGISKDTSIGNVSVSSSLVDCEPAVFCYVAGSSHGMHSAVFSLEVSTWIVLC